MARRRARSSPSIERAAIARLDTELALSQAAIAAGGDRAKEEDILRTWTDYYVAAIHTMTDIEVGGSSRETLAAIDAAAARVKQAGDEHRLALLAHVDDVFCAWLVAHGSSCLELVAAVFGIVSVLLSIRENIWNWPIGIVNVALSTRCCSCDRAATPMPGSRSSTSGSRSTAGTSGCMADAGEPRCDSRAPRAAPGSPAARWSSGSLLSCHAPHPGVSLRTLDAGSVA